MQTTKLAAIVVKPAEKVGDGRIEKFVSLLNKGIEAWQEAGRLLVIALEQDEGFCRAVRIAHPEISLDVLRTFERIGRKLIYAPLLADGSHGARALLECPYDLQVKYATQPISVLISAKGGNLVTEEKKLSELSRQEIKRVFAKDAVLTPDEQVFRLPDVKGKETAEAVAAPIEKPIYVGYYKLECDGKGNVTVTPTVRDPKAQYVRIIPKGGIGSDFHSTVLLFYRTKFG